MTITPKAREAASKEIENQLLWPSIKRRHCGEAVQLALDEAVKPLVEAVRSCYEEINNLQAKLANQEPEGWEGSQRRLRLKHNVQQLLTTYRKEGE